MDKCGRDNHVRPNSDKKKELFDKYVMPNYDFVRKLCERYTASRQDVDENFNDVLLNLYIYIETYDESRDLKTWLHVVTKRHVFSVNKRRMQYGNSLQDIESVYGNGKDCEDNPCEMECCDGGYHDGLSVALDLMPQIHRKAFEMQMSGYSLKEIAKILNESGELESNNINTVKTRVFNARKFLRKHIDREGNLIIDSNKK